MIHADRIVPRRSRVLIGLAQEAGYGLQVRVELFRVAGAACAVLHHARYCTGFERQQPLALDERA
jgi:hypothetical protein